MAEESTLKRIFTSYLNGNGMSYDTYDNWVLVPMEHEARKVLVGYEFSSDPDIILMVNVASGVPAEAYDRVQAVIDDLNNASNEDDEFKAAAQFIFDKDNGLVNLGFTAIAGSCCNSATNILSYGTLAINLFIAAEPVIKAAIEG